MEFHAKLERKQPTVEFDNCDVVEVAELSETDFRHFEANLFEDYDFIIELGEQSHKEGERVSCLLVVSKSVPYGVLVNSEGYSYARYSSIADHAYEHLHNNLDKVARYCVREGMEHSENGRWSISYDEIWEHFHTTITPGTKLCSLLIEKIKQQEDVDTMIATEDSIEIQYLMENSPEVKEGGIEGAKAIISSIGCDFVDEENACNESQDEDEDEDLIQTM